ncbi:OmpA family protein [Kineobactrum salinum]|uniref:OmpA family protein n=1 Tax=Kineobactrum salinum TaxID=2708301 RepID=A0A6C0U5S4_9GAMM|nr:OmpA family protein [Kineobactrum salinum]QIB67326.1 OmpA family protein [Kineobactrum salinum]
MNIWTTQVAWRATLLAGLALCSLFIVSCATAPASPQGAQEVRERLTALQNNPDLAGRARVEFREAEAAVRTAEQPLSGSADEALGAHRVYMADQKVSIAEARATTRFAEEQRERLAEERDEVRLQARTREADKARDEAAAARREALAAQSSREDTAAAAARQAEEYQRQIDALQAATTERGLVVTLGDVLFATGSAELLGGAHSNLDKLVSFLNEYPERRVLIEGHTDNVGSAEYNQGLSQRRADSVRSYLVQQGIPSQSISTSGIGKSRPVADNDTATGRQQNRRVEIIIENPPKP